MSFGSGAKMDGSVGGRIDAGHCNYFATFAFELLGAIHKLVDLVAYPTIQGVSMDSRGTERGEAH